MNIERIITLHCIRNDGRHETKKLSDHTLSDDRLTASAGAASRSRVSSSELPSHRSTAPADIHSSLLYTLITLLN
jgi:hypothetical protein